MNLGNAIKRMRKGKGIKQIDFADMLGIRQSSLSQIESCAIRPNMETMKLICSKLEISKPLLYFMASEPSDIPVENKYKYDLLYPTIESLILKLFK